MTERIEQIRERVEKATEGPWAIHEWKDEFGYTDWRINGEDSSEEAAICSGVDINHSSGDKWFILNAREDIPFLLDRIDELEAIVRRVANLDCCHGYGLSDNEYIVFWCVLEDARIALGSLEAAKESEVSDEKR